MLVKENVETISLLIDKLFDFVKTDLLVQKDLSDYLAPIAENINSHQKLQAAIIPYIFERSLNNKSVIDIFIENDSAISESEKILLSGFKKSISSIFVIKKLLKNGFEMINLVNEMEYRALTLVKMVNFRGVTAEQFLIGRIFPYEDEYYLIEINEFLPSSNKENAYRYAVSRQIEHSELLYQDNPEKLKEIETLSP